MAASSNAINTVERLGRRIACNQAQTQGFSRFMLEQLDPRGRDSALDIGPGLGAQLIPVAKRVICCGCSPLVTSLEGRHSSLRADQGRER